nr:acyltransferase [Bacillus canaveralius]
MIKNIMKIFAIGKKLVGKYPCLIRLGSLIYNIIGFNKTRLKGENNIVYFKSSFLKKTTTDIFGDNNTVRLGDKCFLNNVKVYINGNNNKVIVGNRVALLNTEIYIEDDNNEVIIGDKTTIFGNTHLACIEGKRIIIGNDCMFSSDIVFRTGDSHSIITRNGIRVNESKDIIIGNHVWIGNKVIITKGAYVCDNSIVGTGAIVTKHFNEEGVVLAGNPAKIIKKNINWLRERI